MKKKNGNPGDSLASDGHCKHHILCAAEAIEERTDLHWHYRSTTPHQRFTTLLRAVQPSGLQGKMSSSISPLSLGCLRHVNHPANREYLPATLSFTYRVYTTHDKLWFTSHLL